MSLWLVTLNQHFPTALRFQDRLYHRAHGAATTERLYHMIGCRLDLPAGVTDGSENLVGALRQSMAALGARTIADMQRAELVYAPAVQTEGKSWQRRG